jgi:glycosyltransferase involved in cell wall biosynthesis
MKIVLFTHPPFIKSNSMPRFSQMIAGYLEQNNIEFKIWSPQPFFYNLWPRGSLSKWLGYIDQYILFGIRIYFKIMVTDKKTLFVFCDQAMGPWVPFCSRRPHVIHCHDLLALRSALDCIDENPTSLTGKIYQKFIRWGFQKGKAFIPISYKTQEDLIKFGGVRPCFTRVVHNALNYPFKRQSREHSFNLINEYNVLSQDTGCLLHVGAGQWYKNSVGIIELYVEYCKKTEDAKPLIMVSPNPNEILKKSLDNVPENGTVKFVQGLSIDVLEALYSYADIFLFPSLEEGFGWPIIEAQACGCRVVTTNLAPMNEIGGPSAIYLERYSTDNKDTWAIENVDKLVDYLQLPINAKHEFSQQSLKWAANFESKKVLDEYFEFYQSVFYETTSNQNS